MRTSWDFFYAFDKSGQLPFCGRDQGSNPCLKATASLFRGGSDPPLDVGLLDLKKVRDCSDLFITLFLFLKSIKRSVLISP
jgi:hypothetical protein